MDNSKSENKMAGAAANKASPEATHKAATTEKRGASSKPTAGTTDANRIQRAEQRNYEKAIGDASDGGGSIQAPDGRPSTDGTHTGADTLERQQNGGLTNAEKAVDEEAGKVNIGGGVVTQEDGQREVDPTTGQPPKQP